MYKHYSVLKDESIQMLNIKEDGIYVDATLGGGGHSKEILKRLKKGHLYAFDQDDYAINYANNILKDFFNNYTIIKSNFKNIKEELLKRNVNKIDGIIYDLGVSSFQLDIKERGFSYQEDAILDMRMDKDNKLTAYDVVNTYKKEELAYLIYKYSDEKYANNIAKNICIQREIKPIRTTKELVDIIKKSIPQKELSKKGHPAKKTFQALRIIVNDEIAVLTESLNKVIPMLNKDANLVVITFQPNEDLVVKHIFKEYSTDKTPIKLPINNIKEPDFKIINKKPILPTEKELEENNRSHSAKLRVLRRI